MKIKDRSVKFLRNKLNFSDKKIILLEFFVDFLLYYNKKINLISKSTESSIWWRHILDSAQLVKFVDFTNSGGLNDLGSGAGFPGLVMSIYNDNPRFHVKLYDKSPLKCKFLKEVIKKLKINSAEVINADLKSQLIDGNYVVSRAFKKLPAIIRFSRENCQKKTKFIILKGQKAHEEVKIAFKGTKMRYRLEGSVTDSKSKILIFDSV